MPIIDQLINQDLLTKHWNKIYAQKSEEKRWTSRGIDDISLKDFVKKEDENLNILFVSLEKRLFSFSPAKIVRIEKPDGDDRFLAVPTVRDRIVHSAILEILTSIFYPHINTGVSYCGVKQQFNKKEDRALNIQKAVIKFIGHVKNGNFWIFKSDINKFFDFVPKQKMLDKIFSILPDTSLNDFIKQIIYFEIGNLEELKRKKYPIPNPKLGLAQGSSLSPLFSNLYLANFDKKMPLLFNDRFIRYADDFIVVCKTQKEAKEAQLEAEKNLKN
ncbi:hypothetical protein KJ742_06415, partial [Patescibacteria group bacterium]|nr:hypothetical protein [Patescibacteria group bacterium]